MIETCDALLRLREIAAVSAEAGVRAWVIGLNDLAKEVGCALSVARKPLAAALSRAP
jgi:citrate lyase subunit beta/citryl-CoA lyase